MAKTLSEVDTYINNFPLEIQARMQAIRQTIRKAAPEAEECISYAIPAYKLNGPLVYFAGFKNHIGFYPVPSGMKAFEKELAAYHASKATVQFLHKDPIPLNLVTRIVEYRMKENLGKASKKSGVNFLAGLSAPARRALEEKGIKTVQQLAQHRKTELLSIHGIGLNTVSKLEKVLAEANKKFRSEYMVTVTKFKQLVLSLQNVVEQPHFEKQSYRVKKKIFATLDDKKRQVVIKLNEIEQSVFCAIDKTMIYPVVGAWGKQGWTVIDLEKVSKEVLADALKTAHRIVSGASSAV